MANVKFERGLEDDVTTEITTDGHLYVGTDTGNMYLGKNDGTKLPIGQSDWNQTDGTKSDFIKNKPTIPTKTSDLTNDSGFITSADVPSPANAAPIMDGTAAVGTSTDYAREDHVHPSDTSKQNVLVAGRDIEIQDIVEVEYLESTGTQYIDTGIVVGELDSIETDASFGSKSGDNMVFGSSSQTGTGGLWCEIYENRTWYVRFGSASSFSRSATSNARYQLILKKGYFYINGTSSIYPTYSSMPTSAITIFSNRGSGRFVGKIYGFCIKDEYNNYRLDLVPVRVGTTGYMYDRVSNRLFGNNGSDDFVLGSDVGSISRSLINFVNNDGFVRDSELAEVATSGSYNDLDDKPTIPAAQVNSDWNSTSGVSEILNKPTIPTKTSDLTNDSGFITAADIPTVPEYTVEKLAAAEQGYASSYVLKKDGTQVGATINIPKDMVVSSGEVKTVTVADEPYQGAQVGDKYIDLTISNASQDHIYIPVKDLVDVYTAGNGIAISNSNAISVKIDSNNANGLLVGANGVALATATTSSAGAMSAADKTKIEGIAPGAEVNVQSDWSQTDSTSDDFIKNKPNIPFLVAGRDIDIQDIVEVEYLESTGTQYIDTGIEIGLNIQTNIKFGKTSKSFTRYGFIIGGGLSYQGLVTRTTANSYYVSLYNSSSNTKVFTITDNIFDISFNTSSHNVVINNNTSYSLVSISPYPNNYNIGIFRTPNTTASNNGIGKVYSVSIINNESNEVLRDMIPVRIGTTGYMLDKVSGQLFGNSGTGDFIVGTDVRPFSLISFVNNDGFITSAYVPSPASTPPLMDSEMASVGTSTDYARADHVHQSDTSRVPTTRKVNNKALSADITLTAADVGALPSSTVIPTVGTLNTNNTAAQTPSASESLSGTVKLHKVSKTGTYDDLLGRPTIPDINTALYKGVYINSDVSTGQGLLIKTTLRAYASRMPMFHIIGRQHVGGKLIDTYVTFYNYISDNSKMYGPSVLHCGRNIGEIHAFVYNPDDTTSPTTGYIYIWIPTVLRYNTYHVYCRLYNSETNCVDTITKAAMFDETLVSRHSVITPYVSAMTSDVPDDANLVHLTGNETIAGTKTFTGAVVVPAPTANTHAATKKYIDDIVGDIETILASI